MEAMATMPRREKSNGDWRGGCAQEEN
jgi:hypothetical protein